MIQNNVAKLLVSVGFGSLLLFGCARFEPLEPLPTRESRYVVQESRGSFAVMEQEQVVGAGVLLPPRDTNSVTAPIPKLSNPDPVQMQPQTGQLYRPLHHGLYLDSQTGQTARRVGGYLHTPQGLVRPRSVR